jgi:hypothetical protein
VEIKQGDRLSWTYQRMLTLNSGRFAVIERAHDFALVARRPVLERARGQVVSGGVGGDRNQARYRTLMGPTFCWELVCLVREVVH